MPKPDIKDWEDYTTYFNIELSNIKIPAEVDAGIIRNLSAALNRLYDEIFFDFNKYKSLYENIEDLIDEVCKRNVEGRSDTERKKRGYDAAAEYVNKDKTFNLFEKRREYREKFNFLKGVMSSIETKKSFLIIDSAVLKIEASLLGGLQ